MGEHANKQFVKGAFFLSAAGLLSKILSAAYRVPLQNLTGDLGFYIYQQVYPLLGMMIIVSLYGVPSAIAKIIAEFQFQGKKLSLRAVYLPLFMILLIIAGVGALLLWVNAGMLARLMGDEQLMNTYQWVAIALLFIPITALLRGVYQGYMQMSVIAYSQIGEQIVRVTVILVASYVIAQNGDIYQIGTYGVVASISGTLAAIGILFAWVNKSSLQQLDQNEAHPIPWRYYIRTLLLFGFVASLNHMILLFIQLADVFTLVPSLLKHGLSQIDAQQMKGVFDRGQPLIQLGTVLGSSFALTLIPTISKNRIDKSVESIKSALKMSFYLAIGAVIGLVLIFEETNVLLFENAKGTSSLQVLALSIVLSSLSITCLAIQQSLGFLKRTALFILGAFFVKWLANLLFVPMWGIMGSALATVLSLLALFTVSIITLKADIQDIHFRKLIRIKPLFIAVIGLILFIIVVQMFLPYEVLETRIGLLVYVMAISGLGALLYLFLLLRYQALEEAEIQRLPFASVLKLFNKRRE